MIFIWMPESPYYYAMKGQDEKASGSLKWLLRKENVEPDFLQLKADVNRQISEKSTWSDLFTIKSNRRALAACIFLQVSQALAGISSFETYVQYIFEKSGSLTVSPQVSAMFFSGLLCIVMTGLVFTVDRTGRRKSMVISCLGSAILLLSEAIYFYLKDTVPDIDFSRLQWFPLAGLITYVFFYSVGLGLLPSLMAGELYSVSIKGKALSVTNVAMGFIVFVGTFTFKSLNSVTVLYAPFLVFACCTFCSFVLSFFIIPETKGKTLEEIQQMLKGNSIKM
ncbi:facilitated trehalose transporter Tret1-2 homolog [Sitophilus oryzae]|uniref:Facilitated trehalose transporter Tret1-2 homolog n=1 Tax=Sitophilus oryzae TaxID=7048 RepID=A0A6J2XS88_SITOR|nr:facilitated trehalose transporter Tret1-2 homolog [Sitophilus oryzae]